MDNNVIAFCNNVNPMNRTLLAFFLLVLIVPASAQLKGDSWEKIRGLVDRFLITLSLDDV